MAAASASTGATWRPRNWVRSTKAFLNLTPRARTTAGASPSPSGGEAKGNARKTTGSYYTPDSLVQTLLDSALDPVLDRAEAEADDPAEAMLSVTVIDPACGSGHFLLGAARRMATRVALARTDGARRRGLPPRAARCGARLHPWRRPQPDGGRADQGGAVDRDGRARQATRLPRQQHPLRRLADRRLRSRRAAQGHSRRSLQAADGRRQGRSRKPIAERNREQRDRQDRTGSSGRVAAAGCADRAAARSSTTCRKTP